MSGSSDYSTDLETAPSTDTTRWARIDEDAGRNAVAGVLWMLGGAICFTAMSTVMKHLGANLSTGTIVFFRMLTGLAIIVPFAWLAGGRAVFRSAVPLRQATRSLMGAIALACLIYSLNALSLTMAVALAFTTPLWIVLLSFLFLGERPSRRSILALVLGFVGVIVITRPLVDFEFAMLVALIGAAAGGAALTFVRSMSFHDSSLTMVIWFSAFGCLYSLGPAILTWVQPSGSEWYFLCATGVFGALGLYCAAQAYGKAQSAIIAPVDFVRLPLGALFGFWLFNEVPERYTVLGSGIILVALALTISTRQRRRR